jgi:predicted NUDIX family phosphoesterase
MAKMSLCMRKEDVRANGFKLDKIKPHVYGLFDSLYELPVKLVPRSECETDPSLLQLIPYIVVQDSDSNIFTYTRGNASGEARLKAKLSIGLGGHVDEMPAEPDSTSLYALLQSEAVREIKEEIGLDVTPNDVNFQGLIYEEMSEVGLVHLGLFAFVKLDKKFEAIQEKGHIENGEWLSFNVLMIPENYERLELWSRALVDHWLDELATCTALGI